ncbi:hypothetical protein [Noviherbaspirillum aerium]|uniref:hypothetical protein n=1 Tax=Noviherbaspirillum aerium TaxID=2588497 RepID=UPI00124D339B|nr:hypothetical protein [Noviherbaspirillum aerium]
MPRKPEPVAAPAVIKWTEEEWETIARRLLELKGRELLHSPQLDEIKAKDVFLAQDSLPEERHRKLISISQGFQAIRQRIHGILQRVASTSQNDLFSTSKPTVTVTDATLAVTVDEPRQRHGRKGAKHVAPPAAEPSTPPTAENTNSINEEERFPAAPRVEEQPGNAAPADAGKQPAHEYRDSARQPVSGPSHIGQPKVRTQAAQTPLPAATGDFIEMARPFVSMVCEELANALVNKLMEQGGSQAMSSLFQGAFNGASHSSSREQPRRHEKQGKSSYTRPSFSDEPGMTAEYSPAASHASDEEDGDHAEADVQPLFDPKLPPSANSTFKPMIALIGTSPRDFEDLQQYYPQLELKVVSLDDLRTAPSLRSCQRMMGLREDIPAPADEYLRKTFRNRYLRVVGGLNQVREQLNAWLSNPGTINEQPRWPRKQGNPNGKGQGQGAGFPKKRQFRRPKPVPQS